MRRSWSVVDFILIWLGGLLGSALFLAFTVGFDNRDWTLLAGLGGQYVGNLGVFLILRHYKDDPDIRFEIRGADAAYVGLGLVLQIAVAVALLPLANLLFPDGRPPQEMADIIAGADTPLLQVGLVIAAVVLAPLAEEIMFRGVLLTALERRGRRFGLVVSSLVFAAVHLLGLDIEMLWQSALVVIPPIFGLGLLLGWLTQRTGRLGPAIFLHSGWNMLAAFVLLLPDDILESLG